MLSVGPRAKEPTIVQSDATKLLINGVRDDLVKFVRRDGSSRNLWDLEKQALPHYPSGLGYKSGYKRCNVPFLSCSTSKSQSRLYSSSSTSLP